MTAVLKAERLGKQFPGVIALDDVSIDVHPGRVLAIVGANGAGKSTLIKILTGYYDQYAGQIRVDGQNVSIHQPADAARHGIHVVHQEVDTALIPTLTISENLLLSRFAGGQARPVVRWNALHAEAKRILEQVGLALDPRSRVEALALHEKQMLLIARAVSQQVRYLILDEPTTSLGLGEVERLFALLRALKEQDIGIIYISHRLMEVASIADDILVLRNGRKITQFPVGEFDIGRISEAMLGEALEAMYPPKESTPGEVVLEARGLTRRNALDHISLTARRGEIVGIAGLVGAGKTELLRAIFGADPLDAGEITVGGKVVKLGSPESAVQAGIFLVPEERRAQGVLVSETIRRNTSLPFLSHFARLGGFIDRARERRHTRTTIERLGIIPANPEAEVGSLSGGNQQKVAIGKWLARNARVLLFDEATQGIDVKAKHDVYRIVRDLSQTAAVLYASSDIDEIVGIADRVLVMHDGAIMAELTGDQIERGIILEYSTGARTGTTAGTKELA